MKSYCPPSLALSSTKKHKLRGPRRLTVFVVAAPHALRVVRWCVLAKARLSSVVHRRAAVHRLAAVNTATVSVCGGARLSELGDLSHVMLVDGDHFALGTQLHLCRLVVGVSDSAAMTLELATYYHNLLADKRVSDQAVLVGDSLASTLLHELSAENFAVTAVLNEDAVRLNELFVPKEDVVFVAVADRTVKASLWPFYHLDYLVHGKSVVVFVSAVECTVARRQRHLLAQVDDLDVDNFALLVYHFEVVFVHLQHQPCVFAPVVQHQVARFVAVLRAVAAAQCGLPAAQLVRV